VPTTISALDLVDVVYLMTILADHPRSIDRYIDYFGSGGGPRSRGAEPGTDTATKAVSLPDAMSPKALHPTAGSVPSQPPRVESLAELEKRATADALAGANGNKSRAAAAMGLTRFQLYARLKRFALTE